MFAWLGRWYRRIQRDSDLHILWPACCREAQDIDYARAAFATHVLHDTAWTTDFTRAELIEIIDRLETPCRR